MARVKFTLTGKERALRAIEQRRGALSRAVREGVDQGTLAILARVKSSFGRPGKPVSRTGALSRSVVRRVELEGQTVRGVVGTLALTKEYAPLLEFGGPIRGFFVRPVKKKALAWPVGGSARAARAVLGRRGTYKQARKAARRAGDFAFSQGHWIPPRHQRALPYLRPAFRDEAPRIRRDMRERVAEALGR